MTDVSFQELMRLFYYSLYFIKNESNESRNSEGRMLSVHSQEFWQRTQILSTQEVHFPCSSCFSWLLPQSVDHSHLDEEGEKIMPLLKSLFW